MIHLFKSILHNIGVLAVGFGVAFLGAGLDYILGIDRFHTILAISLGNLLLLAGFLLRVWATYYFYRQEMKVIVLRTQKNLITSGPFQYSRNPLYVGGNVFIFFGAALVLGTVSGIIIIALHLPLMDRMIRREERQLEQAFGDEWRAYARRVRRWI